MISGVQVCVRELAGYESNSINPLTAFKLGFVSIARSSADVFSFVAETIAGSFSCSFLTQLVVMEFAKLELMLLTSDFVFVILNFQGHKEKHPDDIATEQGVGSVLATCRTSFATTHCVTHVGPDVTDVR